MLIECIEITSDSSLKKHLGMALRRAVKLETDTCINPGLNFTKEEIDIGINRGKLAMIKAVRDRVGGGKYSLLELKKSVEAYFAKHGWEFYNGPF